MGVRNLRAKSRYRYNSGREAVRALHAVVPFVQHARHDFVQQTPEDVGKNPSLCTLERSCTVRCSPHTQDPIDRAYYTPGAQKKKPRRCGGRDNSPMGQIDRICTSPRFSDNRLEEPFETLDGIRNARKSAKTLLTVLHHVLGRYCRIKVTNRPNIRGKVLLY